MKTPQTIQAPPRWIELERIENSPGPCCMSFGFDPKPLMQSIETVGLVNSPLLTENEHGICQIVSGFRRIQAAKALGWKKILGRVLLPRQTSPLKCLLLNLHDNLATRELNEVEKGMVLHRLAPLVSRNELLEVYMPLLDLQPHGPILDLYIRIENALERPIKESLAKGRLSVQIASKLLGLEEADRAAAFDLISNLRFNMNQQNQLLEYVIDISRIEKKPVAELLEQVPLNRIRSDPAMNQPQKAKAILRRLRTQRFPKLTRAEAVFKKNVSKLHLPEGVTISAPPYFESPEYQLQVAFKDGVDLKAKIERLASTEPLEGLKNPWEKDV